MARDRANAGPKVELPVITALSMVKGKDGWQVLKLRVQGDRVLSVDASEPDMKAITFEAFRIAVVKELLDAQ